MSVQDARPRLLRSAALLAGGTALGQGVALLALPFVTRLYTPAAIGELGLLLAFVSPASIVATLSFEHAIVTPRREAEASALAVGVGLVSLPLAAALTLVLGGLVVSGTLGFGALPLPIAAFAFPALIGTSVTGAVRYLLVRRARFGVVTGVSLSQNLARAATQLGLGALGASAGGLAVAELAGRRRTRST